MQRMRLRQGGRIYFGWFVLLYSFLLMAVGYAGVLNVTSVFIIPVTSALGISRSGFMFYTTIMMLVSVGFTKCYSVLMGRGVSHIRRIVVLNCILMALGYGGFSRATELWHFYLCAILLGSGFSGLNTQPASILINSWFGGRVKGTVMAIAFSGSGVGGLILAPTVDAVMQSFGWRQGFVVLGLLYLIILLPPAFFLIRDNPQAHGFQKMGVDESEQLGGTPVGRTYQQALHSRDFWVLVTGLFILVLGSGALISNAAAYYVECGFGRTEAAAYTGYMSGMLIVGKIGCGILCDKKGKQFGTAVCFGLFALCFLLLVLLPEPSLFAYRRVIMWGIVVTFGFGCGSVTILPPLWVSHFFGEREYSAILGVVTMVSSLSVAIAGLLAAWVFDLTQTYRYYWLADVMFALIAIALVMTAFQLHRAAGRRTVAETSEVG